MILHQYRFDHIAIFQRFVNDKGINAPYGITFLRIDGNNRAVVCVADAGDASNSHIGKGGAGKQHHQDGNEQEKTCFHYNMPPSNFKFTGICR